MAEPWTPDAVAARFADAAHTAHALPPVRVQGYFNLWPRLVREQWEQLCADDRPLHYFPPSPKAIDRMLETMRWVQWLEVEQRHLVWRRAEGLEWKDIGRRLGCCVRTAQRRWHRALQIVADRLNGTPAPQFLSNIESA